MGAIKSSCCIIIPLVMVVIYFLITTPLAIVQIAAKIIIDDWPKGTLFINEGIKIEKNFEGISSSSKIFSNCSIIVLNDFTLQSEEGIAVKVSINCSCVAIFPTGNTHLYLPDNKANQDWISRVSSEDKVQMKWNPESFSDDCISTPIECATEPPPLTGWLTLLITNIFFIIGIIIIIVVVLC